MSIIYQECGLLGQAHNNKHQCMGIHMFQVKWNQLEKALIFGCKGIIWLLVDVTLRYATRIYTLESRNGN